MGDNPDAAVDTGVVDPGTVDAGTTENLADPKVADTSVDTGVVDPVTDPGTVDPTTGLAGATKDPALTPPEYSPNFKYRYAVEGAKQVEKEIEDLYKPLIKDAETEKAVRELHEKAYGLDFVKQDRDSLKGQYEDVYGKFQEQTRSLQTVGAYIKHKDYNSAFEVLGIPKEDVLNYALNLVQYNKMDPQQRQAYDQQNEERSRYAALELQNQELTQNFQNFAVQQREMEVNNLLMREDIAQVVDSFDQRNGVAGAFRNEVIKRGQYYAQQGQDVPVNQVVTELLSLVGPPPAMQPQAAATPVTQAAQQQKPVIPNIAGKGTSPVKKIPRSTDDLRKLSQQMTAGT